MQSKHVLTNLTLTLLVGLSGAAQAALHDRGGGLVYDDVLNVTWLQDANYAKTSGVDSDGKMTWTQANAWVANLTYYDSVRNVNLTGWRLPWANPVNGVNYNFSGVKSYIGTRDTGYNISAPGTLYAGSTGSEMAYMFYQNLGNQAAISINGAMNDCYLENSDCLVNVGLFTNLVPNTYWSGNADPSSVTAALAFDMSTGGQVTANKATEFWAWAVRPGDVAAIASIPEPETYAMLLAGLGVVGLAVPRRR